jgi:hypothetical protein
MLGDIHHSGIVESGAVILESFRKVAEALPTDVLPDGVTGELGVGEDGVPIGIITGEYVGSEDGVQ